MSRPSTRSSSNSGPLFGSEADSGRLQDLFQYLPSSRVAAFESLRSEEFDVASPEFSAHLSQDTVLTALAQLAAIRVGTDRAYISLVDDEHQVIIAEATASISLQSRDQHDPGDGLHLGASVLEVSAGICATTMQAFLSSDDFIQSCNSDNVYADRTRYVIADLQREDKYKDRPYVTGFPHMRFYAEVPIKSPRGFIIGSLAAIGSTPRGSLSHEHHKVLSEIAATIMRHLEMVRAEKFHQRTNKMLRGLNQYVLAGDAASCSLSQVAVETQRQRRSSAGKEPFNTPPDTETFTSDGLSRAVSQIRLDGADAQRSEKLSPQAEEPRNMSISTEEVYAWQQMSTPASPTSALPIRVRPKTSIGSLAKSQYDPAASVIRVLPEITTLPVDRKSALRLAAETTLEALDLDFVLFFDVDGHSRANSSRKGHSHDINAAGKPAKLLADCMPTNLGLKTDTITEDMIQQLLRDFPRGEILNFTTNFIDEAPAPLDSAIGIGSKGSESSCDVRTALKKALPKVQSALFIPLWSESRQSWIAGGLCGTMTSKRILEEDDLSYTSLMGSCVLSHMSRFDLAQQNQAKADFLSSMSHEIRSPIHGILGNVELARELALSESQRALIKDIDICSLMLLDTFDHILDFAKISTAVMAGSSIQQRGSTASSTASAEVSSRFQLDEIVEDVVDSAVAGHCYVWGKGGAENKLTAPIGQSATRRPIRTSGEAQRNPVAVTFNYSTEVDWLIASPVAVWKRICLNLIGNALKYTSQGSITVSLDFVPKNEAKIMDNEREGLALLKVADTGRGISKDFIADHLFKPFRQENGLAPGTGLGLSIVQSLVQGLGGHIDVDSEIGKGTTFKVAVPVTARSNTKSSVKPTDGTTAFCFAGFEDACAIEESDSDETALPQSAAPTKLALQDILRTRFGVESTALDGEADSKGELVIQLRRSDVTPESTHDSSNSAADRSCSRLIVHDSIYSNKTITDDDSSNEIHLYQPLTPSKINGAIERLLKSEKARSLTTTVKASTDEATPPNTELVTTQNTSTRADAKPSNPTSSTSPNLDSSPSEEGLPKPRVLIVDDNAINVRMLATQVSKLGFAYDSAEHGLEATTRFKDALAADKSAAGQESRPSPYVCVFMDLSMPVMDGFDAAQAIRDLESEGGVQPTQIIALTGLSSSQAQDKAMRHGMDRFVIKPVPMKKIRELLDAS